MSIIGIGEVIKICDYIDTIPKELVILIIEYSYTFLNKRPYKNVVKKDNRKHYIIHKPLSYRVSNFDIKQNNMPIRIDDHVLDLCETHEPVLKIKKHKIQKKKQRKYKKPINKIYRKEYDIKYIQNNIYVSNDSELMYCAWCGTCDILYAKYCNPCEYCLIDAWYDYQYSDNGGYYGVVYYPYI